tara:strand:- start:826 stop:1122 length:297 start_codon:yes stop_codon:yes gene_type:complete
MAQVFITNASTNWIPEVRNVFSKEVAKFEAKKGKPLERQSNKNLEKFLKGLFTRYGNRKVYKRNSLTSYQFSLIWGKSVITLDPEKILKDYKINKGGS